MTGPARSTTPGDLRRDLAAAADLLERLPGLVAERIEQDGSTYRAAADASGVPLMTVNRIARGTHEPTVKTAVALMRWLAQDPAAPGASA